MEVEATGQCRKCGKRFQYSSFSQEKAQEFLDNRMTHHMLDNHPTIWQRVKAWWRK